MQNSFEYYTLLPFSHIREYNYLEIPSELERCPNVLFSLNLRHLLPSQTSCPPFYPFCVSISPTLPRYIYIYIHRVALKKNHRNATDRCGWIYLAIKQGVRKTQDWETQNDEQKDMLPYLRAGVTKTVLSDVEVGKDRMGFWLNILHQHHPSSTHPVLSRKKPLNSQG